MMLPDEMADMKRLRALYVRHNQLQTLPSSLLKDTPVDRMQLEGRRETQLLPCMRNLASGTNCLFIRFAHRQRFQQEGLHEHGWLRGLRETTDESA